MRELLEDGYVPSFCHLVLPPSRTGEHFMDSRFPAHQALSVRLTHCRPCSSNLVDYATPATRAAGEKQIAAELEKMEEGR